MEQQEKLRKNRNDMSKIKIAHFSFLKNLLKNFKKFARKLKNESYC